MGLIIIFLTGAIIGFWVSTVSIRYRSVGTLQAYMSDPGEKPYLFLELSTDVEKVALRRYVILKVDFSSSPK